MQLKSFGCSFIWGSELPDEIPGQTPSQLTWPALVAQELRREYQCYAWGGTGNFAIAQRVLSQIERAESALFVINWTWIDRYDYIDPANNKIWRTIRPANNDDCSDYYYRNLHSQLQDKLLSLSQINFCLDQLEQREIPYISTYMDDLLFETQWHTSAAIAGLQDYVRPHLRNFNGMNFLEWAQHNNFEISATLHPMEAAHKAACDLMLSHSLV